MWRRNPKLVGVGEVKGSVVLKVDQYITTASQFFSYADIVEKREESVTILFWNIFM